MPLNLKKLLLSLFFSLGISVISIALPKDSVIHKPYSISLSAGVSTPASAFGNKSYAIFPFNNSTLIRSGYAEQGYYFRFAFSFLAVEALGVRVVYSGSFNSLDVFTFENLNQSGPISAGSDYYTGQLLFGPYIFIPVGKKLTIEPAIMGGLITSHYPTISSTNSSQQLALRNSSTIGLNINLSVNYILSNCLSMGLYADYALTNIQYYGYDYTNPNGQIYQSTVTKTLELGLWQTGVLISYHF